MTANQVDRARRTLQALSTEDREFTRLIGHLPLVPWTVLGPLRGLGRSAVATHLRSLRVAGIIGVAPCQGGDGHPAGLPYLTGLGRAVAALVEGVSPDGPTLAVIQGHPGEEVHRWRLPQLHAIYDLVAHMAGAGPGPVQVIECERPWRRRFRPLGSPGTRTVVLPARVAMCWADGTSGEFLLLPDLGYVPPAAYGGALARLLKLRDAQDEPLPPLVIATANASRARAWRDLLTETADMLHEPELVAYVGCPEALLAGLPTSRTQVLIAPAAVEPRSRARLHRLLRPNSAQTPRKPGEKEPGKPRLHREPFGNDSLGLLVLLGTTPALTVGEIAVIRGRSHQTAYNHVRWLESRKLIGPVALPSPRPAMRAEAAAANYVDPARFGLELTYFGLEVLAANHLLPPYTLATHLSLAAPDDPKRIERRRLRLARGEPPKDDRTRAARRRDHLLGILDHTRGVNRVHAQWVRDARQCRSRCGWDDAVVQWRSAARCRASDVQPDAFLVYQRDGQRHGAFIEYDRGFETAPQYRRKFNAYREYHESGAYEEDYTGFPAILIISVDKRAEDRIVRTLIRMTAGSMPLSVLVTTEARVSADPAGFLGCVWRGIEPTFTTRCSWPDMQANLPLRLAVS